jgi:hypothetical protein
MPTFDFCENGKKEKRIKEKPLSTFYAKYFSEE